MRSKLAIAAALLVVAGFGVYWYLQAAPKPTETDTIVLADFINTTGETVFDGSLREALVVALAQSPFLNPVSEEKVSETMRQLGHTEERLAPSLARLACQPAGAKAYLVGLIAKEGAGYVVSLDARRCDTDDSMAKARVEANNQQEVLRALGTAAAALRKEAGGCADSLKKFDLPLDRATSPWLEALKAYAEGRKRTREKSSSDGVAPLQKAVALDRRFALPYSSLAVNHYNLNQNALAADEIRQAFEMGDRQTARQRCKLPPCITTWEPGMCRRRSKTTRSAPFWMAG